MMISEAEIHEVLAAIDEADPDFEDEGLEAMRDAFRFALGQGERTAKEFIEYHIGE
jgi:hypothetical protein